MKAASRRDSTDSTGSSPLIRPTIDAVVLLLILPFLLLIVVLVPWGEINLSSPHLQLLGIALTFASVLICLKMACAACSSRDDSVVDDMGSRRTSRQGLLAINEDLPPNYESIVRSLSSGENGTAGQWVITIEPARSYPPQILPEPHSTDPLMEPPAYHTVVAPNNPEQAQQNPQQCNGDSDSANQQSDGTDSRSHRDVQSTPI